MPRAIFTQKVCSKCRVQKHVRCFGSHRATRDKLSSQCRACGNEYNKRYRKQRNQWYKDNPDYRRWKHLKRRYRLSREQYEQMLAEQAHACKLCGKHESESRGGRLVVDHCHSSEKVRGLLCHKCNVMLGMAEDDKSRLRAALTYLEKH